MTRGVVVFWCLLLALIAVDFSSYGHPRVEPAAFALGSGQASVGGHCSGR
jgi:hypothetical protein